MGEEPLIPGLQRLEGEEINAALRQAAQRGRRGRFELPAESVRMNRLIRGQQDDEDESSRARPRQRG